MALYNLYRPQTVEDVLGQQMVLKSIFDGLRAGRVSHAYLLSGPRGTGKTTIARLIAKFLNCTSDEQRPCGVCDNCQDIASGWFVDLVEIDTASHRGVDSVRNLRDSVNFSPVMGRYKVIILDEVHMLTNEAANALLKTLEEPPPQVVFILATTDEGKLISTIKSRCQVHRFTLLGPDLILKRLQKINSDENLNMPLKTLEFVAKEAKGSMRDAISMLDMLQMSENKELESVMDMLGRARYQDFYEFVECLIKRDASRAIGFVNNLFEKGIDLDLFVFDLDEWFRGLMYLATKVSFTHPALTLMKKQQIMFNTKDLVICLSIFNHQLWKSTIPQLGLELAVLQCCESLGPVEDF